MQAAAISSSAPHALRVRGRVQCMVKCADRNGSAALYFPRPCDFRHHGVIYRYSALSIPANATSFSVRRSLSTHSNHSKHNSNNSQFDWLPSFAARIMTAFGLIHVVSEYGVELTLCEGPSMMPTILPAGEIILVDRLTPRLFGLQGGHDGAKRAEYARQLQEDYQKQERQKQEQKAKSLRRRPTEHHETWHQRMVAVDELPKSGKWKRMFAKCTTGLHVGDVVVVQHPDRSGTVCKRILGLPGDVVVQPASNFAFQNSSRGGLLVIPDGHLWIEGDNSMNSSDSRNYGPIPASLLVGRVLLRLWPVRGDAILERGARPLPPPDRPFSGSTILPAGYEGEVILKHAEEKPSQ